MTTKQLFGKTIRCLRCGTAFENKATRGWQAFCSDKCRRDYKRYSGVTVKPCPECRQDTFPSLRHNRASGLCSWTCENDRRKRLDAERRADRSCVQCGASIPDKRRDAIYCGERCRDRARRVRERADRPADWEPNYRSKPGPNLKARKYQPGDRWGELTLIEYLGKSRGGTQARFACNCGATKVLRLSNVVGTSTPTPTRNCADRSKHPDPRKSEAPAINTWHRWIKAKRGPALEHPCVFCGKVGKGNQWAYRWSSYEPIKQATGKDKGQVYSLDLGDYWVLCKRHHAAFDRASKAMVPENMPSLPHVALKQAYDPYGDAPT